MNIRVGCAFSYDAESTTPAVVLVRPRIDTGRPILEETWSIDPASTHHSYNDLFGNRIDRVMLPVGVSTIQYDALVAIDGQPDPVVPNAIQHAIEDLPDDLLLYTLSSRYCPSEALAEVAWRLFGNAPLGWGRVQAVCDWINSQMRYGMRSTPLTTAVDVYVSGGGMCRDFAHLAITFCRALGIPARYVFGYLPDIDVEGPQPPMDFHAWFDAYLDNQWWTFDARFNRPRIGRIPIGYGRDAVDVAMVTSYGSAMFQRMTVWSDEVPDEPAIQHPRNQRSERAEDSEGLIRGTTRPQRTAPEGS